MVKSLVFVSIKSFSKLTVDVWGRYHVIYTDGRGGWDNVRREVERQLKVFKDREPNGRLVTRYTFEITQTPTMTVRLVGEKYRPYRNPEWAASPDYAVSPLEFVNSGRYLSELQEAAASDEKTFFTDLWMAYLSINEYFSDPNNIVFVYKGDPNFAVLNQLSLMVDHVPWVDARPY